MVENPKMVSELDEDYLDELPQNLHRGIDALSIILWKN
jgi:hypothetical protein